MNAQEIVDRLTSQLKDPNYTRWPISDLVNYIEDGQRQTCLLRPDAFMLNEVVKLAPGVKQVVPLDSHRFARAVMNQGADGATPGQGITQALIPDMDRFKPGWRADTASATVTDYLFDYDQPLLYWVYPPVPASPSVYIEIQTAKTPANIVDLGADLDISDVYSAALYEYGMYRAFSKDDETTNNIEAEKHRVRFFDAIGIKAQSDKALRTRTRTEGG